MIKKPPIFLFAFANDEENRLHLEEEERKARELLQIAHDNRKIEFHSLGATTLDDIYKTFNRFHNRIAVFHYGGHSGDTFLELRDKKARVSNLSVLMGMQDNLKLVFLNGCANKAQVEVLLDKGVPAVNATSAGIKDPKAILFSKIFYDALSNRKSIRESFDTAKARLEEELTDADVGYRHLGIELDKGEEFPWGLYSKEDADLDWKIPDPYKIPGNLEYSETVILDSWEFDRSLLEGVFEEMARLDEDCKNTLKAYYDPKSRKTKFTKLQTEIYEHFPRIITTHIAELFTKEAQRKGRLRLVKINETYLVLGKFLCSIALANLWQVIIDRKARKEPNLLIRAEYKNNLKDYLLMAEQDADAFNYVWLLSAIDRIFNDNDIKPFINELTGFNDLLNQDEALFSAYHFLEFELKPRLQTGNIGSIEVEEMCIIAEQHLWLLLKRCAFLITYELVSVNDILVKKSLVETAANFEHKKVLLHGKEETAMDTDSLLRKEFTCNNAIVISKNFDSGDDPLTLSPFLMDQNAYKKKEQEDFQPRIYFWAGNQPDGKKYYQHTEVLKDGFHYPLNSNKGYRKIELQEIGKLWDHFKKDLNLD